jgi:hypothetical protein
MVKAKLGCPISYHSPAVQENNTESDEVEHSLRPKTVSLLNCPEKIYANGLKI